MRRFIGAPNTSDEAYKSEKSYILWSFMLPFRPILSVLFCFDSLHPNQQIFSRVGRVFRGRTSIKQWIMCLAQEQCLW